jgi:hypothetical protein
MSTNEHKSIRVFPRRISDWTPTDELAFVGEPPLFKLPDLPVFISVTFTWDKIRGEQLYRYWQATRQFRHIKYGGPAWGTKATPEFTPGRFLKEGVTITSRGCSKRCPWCLVYQREGQLREINIAPGHIVQDNNLLACSRAHVEDVFAMLAEQKETANFAGGLDVDYLEPWHVEAFKGLRIAKCGLCVACDCDKDLARLDKAADLLADFSIEKKRCYVLVGFNGETQDQAHRRCEAVLAKGFLPFAQFYRGPDAGLSRGSWGPFCAFWSQPRYYRKTCSVTSVSSVAKK